jgi:hypothetical protein
MGLSALRDALHEAHGQFIQLHLLEGPRIDGLVSAVGAAACVLVRLNEGLQPDGWHLVPLSQIDGLRDPGPNGAFVMAALRARATAIPPAPTLNLSAVGASLRDVSRCYPLVEVSFSAGTTAQGQLVTASDAEIRLVLMEDDAQWQDGSAVLEPEALERATFGTALQEALQMVAAGVCYEASSV